MKRASILLPLALALPASIIPGGALAEPPVAVAPSTPEDLERLAAQLAEEEKAKSTELDEAKTRLDVTKKRIIARGRAYYKLVRAGLMPAGAGFEAMVDHAAQVERTRRALDRDVAAETALIKRIDELKTKIARVRAERAPLDVQREAMVRARRALQETEERRSAFVRAFETSVRPDAVAIYGADTGPRDSDAQATFRSLKGHLPFPIAGRAEVRKVSRFGGPGIELVAVSGAAVRTVAAARVAFADRYEDYGLTVILDHGDRYYSVYGALGGIDVKVGDSLQSGVRIGSVGGAPLYFELRHNAASIDPAPWFGL